MASSAIQNKPKHLTPHLLTKCMQTKRSTNMENMPQKHIWRDSAAPTLTPVHASPMLMVYFPGLRELSKRTQQVRCARARTLHTACIEATEAKGSAEQTPVQTQQHNLWPAFDTTQSTLNNPVTAGEPAPYCRRCCEAYHWGDRTKADTHPQCKPHTAAVPTDGCQVHRKT
jgi:hypothetical protein